MKTIAVMPVEKRSAEVSSMGPPISALAMLIAEPATSITKLMEDIRSDVAELENLRTSPNTGLVEIKARIERGLAMLREPYLEAFDPEIARSMVVCMIDVYPTTARWEYSAGYEDACVMLLGNPSRIPAELVRDCSFTKMEIEEKRYPAFPPKFISIAIMNLITVSKFIPAPSEVLRACQVAYDSCTLVGRRATRAIG